MSVYYKEKHSYLWLELELREKFGLGSIIIIMGAKNKQYSEAEFSYCAAVIKGSEFHIVTLLYSKHISSSVESVCYCLSRALFWERDIMKNLMYIALTQICAHSRASINPRRKDRL